MRNWVLCEIPGSVDLYDLAVVGPKQFHLRINNEYHNIYTVLVESKFINILR